MKYTLAEQQALDMMKRTDFKNLSKNDTVCIVSKLSELRPDVAKDVIAQFPEFAQLLQSSLEDYKGILGDIIASDDKSLKQFYDLADKDMKASAESRRQFYDLAKEVYAGLSKRLERPDLTAEEYESIYARQMEILKVVSEKDTEIRGHETKTLESAAKKDSEKRKFNWRAIAVGSMALVVSLGFAASALGGDFNMKLPKKQ